MNMNPRIPADIKRLSRKLTAEAKKRGMSVVDLAKEKGYFQFEVGDKVRVVHVMTAHYGEKGVVERVERLRDGSILVEVLLEKQSCAPIVFSAVALEKV